MRTDGHTDGRADRQIDRQRDMTKLTVAFRNFANVPENITSASFRPSSTWEIFLMCYVSQNLL